MAAGGISIPLRFGGPEAEAELSRANAAVERFGAQAARTFDGLRARAAAAAQSQSALTASLRSNLDAMDRMSAAGAAAAGATTRMAAANRELAAATNAAAQAAERLRAVPPPPPPPPRLPPRGGQGGGGGGGGGAGAGGRGGLSANPLDRLSGRIQDYVTGGFILQGVNYAGSAIQSGFHEYQSQQDAQRFLESTGRQTGRAPDDVLREAEVLRSKYGLTKSDAQEFEASALRAGKFAGIGATGTRLLTRSVADLSAASGTDLSKAKQLLGQVIRGEDEAFDKLLGRGPQQIYSEYAKALGTTAEKLDDTAKVHARVNAIISAGNDVLGEQERRLDTNIGRWEKFKNRVTDASGSLAGGLFEGAADFSQIVSKSSPLDILGAFTASQARGALNIGGEYFDRGSALHGELVNDPQEAARNKQLETPEGRQRYQAYLTTRSKDLDDLRKAQEANARDAFRRQEEAATAAYEKKRGAEHLTNLIYAGEDLDFIRHSERPGAALDAKYTREKRALIKDYTDDKGIFRSDNTYQKRFDTLLKEQEIEKAREIDKLTRGAATSLASLQAQAKHDPIAATIASGNAKIAEMEERLRGATGEYAKLGAEAIATQKTINATNVTSAIAQTRAESSGLGEERARLQESGHPGPARLARGRYGQLTSSYEAEPDVTNPYSHVQRTGQYGQLTGEIDVITDYERISKKRQADAAFRDYDLTIRAGGQDAQHVADEQLRTGLAGIDSAFYGSRKGDVDASLGRLQVEKDQEIGSALKTIADNSAATVDPTKDGANTLNLLYEIFSQAASGFQSAFHNPSGSPNDIYSLLVEFARRGITIRLEDASSKLAKLKKSP